MKIQNIVAAGVFFLLLFTTSAQTRPGSLRGLVVDATTGETIPFCNIRVFTSDDAVIAEAQTDIDGLYNLHPIVPGIYSVEASFTGYAKVRLTGLTIVPNTPTIQNFELHAETSMLEEVEIVVSRPLIDKSRSSSVMTSEDIVHMAVRDISSVKSRTAGVTRDVPGPGVNIRSNRSEGTVYFIDGVKVRGSVNIPQASISQSTVQFSGTPACIGDEPNPLFNYGVSFLSPQHIEYEVVEIEPVKTETRTEEISFTRILTAGEIHDFSKWELWEDYGKESFVTWKEHWQLNPVERYPVQVKLRNGMPVVDALIHLINAEGDIRFSTRTDNTGKAELWSNLFSGGDSVQAVVVEFEGEEYVISHPHTLHQGINTLEIDGLCAVPNAIDICFMVDATGSMSDEINYLKAELQDVIARVASTLPESTIRLGNVFYRDQGDEYVTRFTDLSKDIDKGIDFIKNQSAGGGGDFPEAVIEALDVSINQLSWSDEAIARIMFLVLDAPPHHDSAKVAEIQELVASAAAKGIKLIPVASSGIDKSTEYLLRSMALITNGTYTFLTDDSGVGNPHLKPTTDSYEVELLNDLLVRLIHQFTYTPRCSDFNPVVEVPKLEPHVSATSFPDSTALQVEANDSASLVNVNPRDIKQAIKDDFSRKFNWHYYPNPTRDIVNVEFNQKISELFVTDLRGKILQRIEVNNQKSVQISLADYPVGTYFIRFIHDKSWVSERVVRIF